MARTRVEEELSAVDTLVNDGRIDSEEAREIRDYLEATEYAAA